MSECKRNFKNAQIKAESDAELMPKVTLGDYSHLFKGGHEMLVLFDFKTSIHPKMHDTILPGLNSIKREFKKAYAEILLRRQGDRIKFAFVDHEQKESQEKNNVVSLVQKRHLINQRTNVASSKKLGEIKFITFQDGVIGAININDMTSDLNAMFGNFLGKSNNSPFDGKIKHICGVDKYIIFSKLEDYGFSLPSRKSIDFSLVC